MWQRDLSCKKKTKIPTFCDYQLCFCGERLYHLGGNQWPPFSTSTVQTGSLPRWQGLPGEASRASWPEPVSPCPRRGDSTQRCPRDAPPAGPCPALPAHSRPRHPSSTSPVLPNQDFIVLITIHLTANPQIQNLKKLSLIIILET